MNYHTKARHGVARRGVARTAGRNPCFIFEEGINMNYHTKVRYGEAGHGEARRGVAWQGQQGEIPALYLKK